jgi:hypothetical protein
MRNSTTGSWDLSRPATLLIDSEDEHHLLHVSWNHIGGMLSVFDSCGRISIYDTAGNTSGRMNQIRKGENDPENDMEAIAASYWCSVLPYAEKV